jgi:hypothetical protein
MVLYDDLRVLVAPLRNVLRGNDVFQTLYGFPFPENDPDSNQTQFLLKQNRYERRLLARP